MSDVVEKDVREIRQKVDALDKSVDLLVRANRKQIIEDLMVFFGNSKDRVKVFLAIDGEKSVNEVTSETHIALPNVSRRVTELEHEGLVRFKKMRARYKIYEQTEKVAIINLTKELRKKFGDLTQDKPTTAQSVGIDVKE